MLMVLVLKTRMTKRQLKCCLVRSNRHSRLWWRPLRRMIINVLPVVAIPSGHTWKSSIRTYPLFCPYFFFSFNAYKLYYDRSSRFYHLMLHPLLYLYILILPFYYWMTPLCRIFGHLLVGICYRRTPVIYFTTSTMILMSLKKIICSK